MTKDFNQAESDQLRKKNGWSYSIVASDIVFA